MSAPRKRRPVWVTVVTVLLLALAGAIGGGTAYLRSALPDADLEISLFYWTNGLTKGEPAALAGLGGYIVGGILVGLTVLLVPTLNFTRFRLPRLGIGYSVVVLLISISLLGAQIGAPAYLSNQFNPSTLYEEHYVEPEGVVVAPVKPRNLVFVLVESLENTVASRANGGQADPSVIPALEKLALDPKTTSFSNNSTGLGGPLPAYGSHWSLGGMVAMGAGVPLKAYISNNMSSATSFMPGTTFMSDILAKAGYQQSLLIGTDPKFGGIDKMMAQHGDVKIIDPAALKASGRVPPGYHVWWGIEDRKMLRFAREEATSLSKTGDPFAMTVLVEDTHYIDGYMDPECPRPHKAQYDNVHDCTSSQVADFTNWIQRQPFGPDTTIVIIGDHLGMQTNYYNAKITTPGYQRTTYNAIINPAVTAKRTNDRQVTSMDMFPTTLAAMGFTIKGDRLGLGANLFSDTPTLAETMGMTVLNEELARRSAYYDDKLFREPTNP